MKFVSIYNLDIKNILDVIFLLYFGQILETLALNTRFYCIVKNIILYIIIYMGINKQLWQH